ncbi:putative pyrroline-5-carboxylate reductase [Dendryphion nanum]|uniref:Pyrroline-5-carboxylate reductase n=1 Tax=Dendryphion nanum TaxID=256645 RepID=A0A9P9D4F4_9PLEO|nr:putative pyrroline-5-carboxylate reductase [Dendryphion nanum]
MGDFDNKPNFCVDSHSPRRLTFIGGGHLAQALVHGIYAQSPWASSCKVSITARRSEHVKELQVRFPHAFVTCNNIDSAIWVPAQGDRDGSHTLIICTRPADVPAVAQEISPILNDMDENVRPTVMTMCPGIVIKQLEDWLPMGTAIVRSMPNTPVGCCQGATALVPNKHALPRINGVQKMLCDVSPRVCVLEEEKHLDVVAAIAGSAPAYFYYMIEALVLAGEAHGLSNDAAQSLVTQSCLGAGMLARDSNRPTATLRQEVCVPGGSTEKAIGCLKTSEFHKLIGYAVDTSVKANRAMRNVNSDGSRLNSEQNQ